MSSINQYLLTFFILLAGSIVIGASYYKFVVLRDFETVFYTDCDEGETGCFINNDDCVSGESELDCAHKYKAYVVKQSDIDSVCTSDDGECLLEICSVKNACEVINCKSSNASVYGITDECNETKQRI